ncbi:MAG TPA: hypothetical protein VK835_13205 [Bacteroidia bacterium]|jgi:hypothetical protein|nr:hypothetical protein [Bacteroidia bacterium]
MKKLLAVLLLAMASFLNVKGQGDYLITTEGVKVPIEGNALLSTAHVSFLVNGKREYYKHTDLKFLTINKRLFLSLPLKEGKMMRLQEIVCYNDNAILTSFYQNGGYNLLVFDWDLKTAVPHRLVSNKKSKQKEFLDENYKPLFKDCSKAFDIFYQNIANTETETVMQDGHKCKVDKVKMLDNVYALKCGGTKDINTLIKTYLASSSGK